MGTASLRQALWEDEAIHRHPPHQHLVQRARTTGLLLNSFILLQIADMESHQASHQILQKLEKFLIYIYMNYTIQDTGVLLAFVGVLEERT